ncbi:MAG: MBL fold metallo-hydrolase [Desulfurococcaceae archaeon]
MRIVILSDDKTAEARFIAKHSFSLYIQVNYDIYLFDLGVDPFVIEHNAQELGLDISIVDYAVISHEHTTHFGGFKYLASEAPFTEVYIPFGSMESLGRILVKHGLRPIEINKWIKLSENIYITKPYYGPPHEHLMVIEMEKDLIVLSGCLHPGLDALLDVTQALNKRISGLIGGLHLYNAPEHVVNMYLDKITNKFKPDFIIPLHCTGNKFVERVRERSRDIEIKEYSTGDIVEL